MDDVENGIYAESDETPALITPTSHFLGYAKDLINRGTIPHDHTLISWRYRGMGMRRSCGHIGRIL